MDLKYQIPRLCLLWVLASVALVVVPHVLRLPAWIGVLSLMCILWRLLIFAGRAPYPGRLIKALFVFIALPLILYQFRIEGVGLDASVCLLILGAVFKLVEMRYKRDIIIVIVLAYVLAMVGFIYSQTIPASLYALLVVTVITGALISLNRDNARNTFSHNSRLAVRMVLQSVPLMVALFIFVPRATPLWSMPIPAPSNTTGVNDQMTPGDISNLGRSVELAFRVSFEGDAPTHEQLYWRGLVFDHFDGRTWQRSGSAFQNFNLLTRYRTESRGVAQGQPVSYDVILEPTQRTWIYAMQLADFNTPDVVRDRNYVLHTSKPITQRYRYRMRSYLNYQTDLDLDAGLRARSLQLPEDSNNLRSRAMVAQLRSVSSNDRDYTTRLLRYFREQPFFYTLNPPLLGESSIDEFMFDTREGFCEHYASSFVYFMRAAGIPARVVVGYQGGEYNPFENYTMVYQYNAHAWAEVWLEGEGWVRFDPTAAVAPDRIKLGVEAVFADQPGFMENSGFSMMRFRNTAWVNSLRLRMDALDYAWNRWVVSYDEDIQLEFLEKLFGDSTQSGLIYSLGISMAVFFGIAALFMLNGRRGIARDPATKLYLAFGSDLARVGLGRQRGEGPQDYCERVSVARPDLADEMKELTALYMRLSYLPAGAIAVEEKDLTMQRFKREVRATRLRLLSGARLSFKN